MKKPGRVPSEKVIGKLAGDGIVEVTVDFSRSTFTTKIEPASWKRDKSKLVAFDNEVMRAHRLLKESKATVNKMLENVFADQVVDIEPLNKAADDIVESLSNNSDALHPLSALRTKDAYLAEHSLNVGSFARYLGWSRDAQAQLIVGGIVHDIGKTRVDLEILNKPGRLEPHEFEHMKLHQVHSKSLLNEIEDLTQMSR
ncbi:HD-GYP domain-containing protein [Psychrobium sp. nBUS_13]|uniref:HD-GYP domain-containing protein n=1 Tax=Psychrobium sp. nBUS_13 TaxID=3395319 RepID=UPI003EB6A14F